MLTDLRRPDVRPVSSGPAAQPVRQAPLALALTGLVLALGLALSGAVSVVRDGGEDGTAIRTTAGPERPLERGTGRERPGSTATVLGRVFPSTVSPDSAPTTAAAPTAPTATTAPAGRATTVAPPPATIMPPATTPSSATSIVPQAAVQTGGQPAASTVPACRNSTDPACGDFRFDPQPGPDSPMTVEVTAVPASSVAGQPMVFQ